MQDAMNTLKEALQQVKDIEQYRTVIDQFEHEYYESEMNEQVKDIVKLSEFIETSLSPSANISNMNKSRNEVLRYISDFMRSLDMEKQSEGVEIIRRVLDNFHVYCRRLYQDEVHGKCSETFKANIVEISIENEYDLQRLVYSVVSALYPDATIENGEDTGHHTVRKDIVVVSEDVAIELKCTRSSMNERNLGEEVAADSIHYTNSNIIFYIYDKANVIKNPEAFKNTYESKCVDGKNITVIIYRVDALSK